MGERVTVYETPRKAGPGASSRRDGYVGWLSANALARARRGADPQGVARCARFGFPGPDIKLPPVDGAADGRRAWRSRGRTSASPSRRRAGIVPARPSRADQARDEPISSPSPRRFSARPICGAARPSLGIDCSGLVQVALQAAGIACPRDSDMQERALGTPVALARPAARRSHILERPRRHRARRRNYYPRQRASHDGGDRAGAESAIARIKAAGSEVTSVKRV